ncbi:DUF4340 domain-containing protein [bacterium]|nr:DUF4340 domain-containing protein [bacterium]
MNWKGTLALAAVAGGLLAYAYFVEAKKDAPPAQDTTEVKLWDAKKDAALSRLLIEDASGHKAEYVRKSEADGWRYAPQATHSLETFSWDNPYENLAAFTAERKVEDKATDLAAYGLDKPTLTMALGDAKKPERYKVLVGGKSPMDGASYYVRVNQDPAIYQVSSWKVDGWLKLVSAPPVATPSPAPDPAASPATDSSHAH